MIYLAPSGCQSLQRLGGLWGPALLSREDCFLKSCPYLAMLHHVCVPDLRIPQQPPRGPLRSLKGAVGGQTPAALSHICPLLTSLSQPALARAARVWSFPIIFVEMDGNRLQLCSRCWPWHRLQQQSPAKKLLIINFCSALTFFVPYIL